MFFTISFNKEITAGFSLHDLTGARESGYTKRVENPKNCV
jgi:hypothetical protein